MTKICWVMYPWLSDRTRITVYAEAVDLLRERGHDVVPITFGELQSGFFNDSRDFEVEVDQRLDPSSAEMRELEREHEVSLRHQAYTATVQERPEPTVASQLSPSETRVRESVVRLTKLVESFQALFERRDFDAAFMGVGPSLAFRAAWMMSRRYDVSLRMIHQSPFSSDRCLLFDDQFARPSDLVGFDTSDPSDEALQAVRDHVEDIHGVAPTSKKSLGLTGDRVRKYVTKLFDGFSRDAPRRTVLRSTIRRYATIYHNSLRRFDDFDPSTEYVYLPLHATVDTQLLLREDSYVHQESLVRILSNNAPVGVTVYVKEHPAFAGRYRGAVYKTVDRLSNVRLIPTNTDPHRVLDHADAVATIRSTAGLEALMHDVPVLAFGEPFYARSDSVTSVTNLGRTDSYLHRALSRDPDRAMNRRYLAQIFESQFDLPYWFPEVGENHAEQLVEGMLAAMPH